MPFLLWQTVLLWTVSQSKSSCFTLLFVKYLVILKKVTKTEYIKNTDCNTKVIKNYWYFPILIYLIGKSTLSSRMHFSLSFVWFCHVFFQHSDTSWDVFPLLISKSRPFPVYCPFILSQLWYSLICFFTILCAAQNFVKEC